MVFYVVHFHLNGAPRPPQHHLRCLCHMLRRAGCSVHGPACPNDLCSTGRGLADETNCSLILSMNHPQSRSLSLELGLPALDQEMSAAMAVAYYSHNPNLVAEFKSANLTTWTCVSLGSLDSNRSREKGPLSKSGSFSATSAGWNEWTTCNFLYKWQVSHPRLSSVPNGICNPTVSPHMGLHFWVATAWGKERMDRRARAPFFRPWCLQRKPLELLLSQWFSRNFLGAKNHVSDDMLSYFFYFSQIRSKTVELPGSGERPAALGPRPARTARLQGEKPGEDGNCEEPDDSHVPALKCRCHWCRGNSHHTNTDFTFLEKLSRIVKNYPAG